MSTSLSGEKPISLSYKRDNYHFIPAHYPPIIQSSKPLFSVSEPTIDIEEKRVTIIDSRLSISFLIVALHIRLKNVQPYKQAPQFSEAGAGVNIISNVNRMLDAFRLQESIIRKSSRKLPCYRIPQTTAPASTWATSKNSRSRPSASCTAPISQAR